MLNNNNSLTQHTITSILSYTCIHNIMHAPLYFNQHAVDSIVQACKNTHHLQGFCQGV